MSEWREFEQLAVRIYEQLTPQGAVVTHDDRIRGHQSGIDRQIDVSIRFEVAGHHFLTIVQSKDIGTPADVNVVGEFASVVEDIRANKGVLICRNGFTTAALTLAASKGIDACNIHDAASEKWALEIRVPILWTELTPTVTGFGAAHLLVGDNLSAAIKDWCISSDGGITRVDVLGTFEKAWNEGQLPRDVGPLHNVHDPSGKFHICVRDVDGQIVWRQFDLVVTYTACQRSWLGSFSPEECIGLLHYEDGRFVGRFPAAAIPMARHEGWVQIDDPELLATRIPGSMIVSEGWQMFEGSADISNLELIHSETGEVIRADGEDGGVNA